MSKMLKISFGIHAALENGQLSRDTCLSHNITILISSEKLCIPQDVSNTKKVMRSKAERVLGRNQESSLSDEAPRADQAYHCQLALHGLIWELFIILDRILKWDFSMSRQYILAGNSKWQNQDTKTQSYQHWSLWITVKPVRNLMKLQVFSSLSRVTTELDDICHI